MLSTVTVSCSRPFLSGENKVSGTLRGCRQTRSVPPCASLQRDSSIDCPLMGPVSVDAVAESEAAMPAAAAALARIIATLCWIILWAADMPA